MEAIDNTLNICIFEGDGIGPEVMAPTLRVLDAACAKASLPKMIYTAHPAGAGHFQATGDALPQASIDAARASDAILLSAMGLPAVRKADGTEITPQIDIRFALDLYAGVRPVRVFPGQTTPFSDARANEIDFVLVRESTEGLFAHMHEGVVTEDYATETLRITRATSEKLFDFTFRMAERRAARKGREARVTCIDKANVFRAFWFFREIFEKCAMAFPNVQTDAAYVDAVAMWMVQRPWEFDVMVTENMFGDILSDLGAGLLGSLGLAPSADIGDKAAVFQPCHGSAPDIAGKGIANPLAMILSASMMCEWLAAEKSLPALEHVAMEIEDAVAQVIVNAEFLTADLGGTASTEACAEAVISALNAT